MLVKERMSRPVLTISPEMSVKEALDCMQREHVRRFPVVNHKGRLVGIVSEKDLLKASPSEATSLSIFEIRSLLHQITVGRVMTRSVITVTDDTPIEEAARLMADYKIGGLPVLKEGRLVGIITETDLFHIFLELFGARTAGVRVTVLVQNEPENLSRLTCAIGAAGGQILALGTVSGPDSETLEVVLKVKGAEQQALYQAMLPWIEEIIDLRADLSEIQEQVQVWVE